MKNTIHLKGKYTDPIMYVETVDDSTIGQVMTMANERALEDSIIRIMPDCHYGKGSTIGTTIRFEQGIKRVVPDIVGVDIGCSISATKLNVTDLDSNALVKLDAVINQYVPAGHKIHGRPSNRINQKDVDAILNNLTLDSARTPKEKNRIKLGMGTLGGGNHYIAIERAGDDIYLMIHTGSRRLGAMVAKTHQSIADAYHDNQYANDSYNAVINELKQQGRQHEIEAVLKELKRTAHINKPNLKYLEGTALDNYLNDMHYAQAYAELNHQAIANEIVSRMGWEVVDHIHSMHNYIDIDNATIRKGATDASEGNRLIVPLNMRDGSLIAVGKGNADWNESAPHGAGRVLSRSKAKALLSLSDYQATMKGVHTTSVHQSTLDEAPEAYKPAQEIIDNTTDTMTILSHVKPLYNYKAH